MVNVDAGGVAAVRVTTPQSRGGRHILYPHGGGYAFGSAETYQDFIQVGSDELLLDDSVRMADRLRSAGWDVEIEIWPRMPHAWQLWPRFLPEACQAIERIGAFVREPLTVPLVVFRLLRMRSHNPEMTRVDCRPCWRPEFRNSHQ